MSLNTWYGTQSEVLGEYLEQSSGDLDIFCLQETNGTGIEKIIDDLCSSNDYIGEYSEQFYTEEINYSLATLVRRPTETIRSQQIQDVSIETGWSLATELVVEGSRLMVVNIHGVPFPGDKLDTPARLKQTKSILEYLESLSYPAIVAGDFNLLPETESIQLFERAGLRNLIKDYQIKTTRNCLAWKLYPDSIQFFADYMFVSPGIKVNDFLVPENEVSDHLPMILDFDLA